MAVLMIGEIDKARIAKAIAYAAENIVDPKEAIAAYTKDMVTYDKSQKQFTIELPVGFRVTYTREQQPPGLFHHISISRNNGMAPNPEAVNMILEEYGMRPVEQSAVIWIEQADNGLKALNIIQPVMNS